MNSLMVIFPYKKNGVWMFDDNAVGLREEPFVEGIPEIIEHAVEAADIKNANKGFTLTFSATPFPSRQHVLHWVREDFGGNIYHLDGTNMQGWLCPALFQYFSEAPKTIYCKAEARAA